MTDVKRYTYRSHWSDEDQAYVATVGEFPYLSCVEADPGAALAGLWRVVEVAVEDLRAAGEPIPDPFGVRPFSGKILLRMPPELHRRLAMDAAEQHVSVNQLAVTRLSAAR